MTIHILRKQIIFIGHLAFRQWILLEKTLGQGFAVNFPILFSTPFFVTVSQPQYTGDSGPNINPNAQLWRPHSLSESGFMVKCDGWITAGEGQIGIGYAVAIGIS